MNVNTILVSPEEAETKLRQLQAIVGRRRTREDEQLESLYASISRGARVLNLAAAFKQTALNELGQPRLAVARADWKQVNFFPRKIVGQSSWDSFDGAGGFTPNGRQWNALATAQNISLPKGTFDNDKLTRSRLASPVPYVPPEVRPKYALSNYHILFEVKEWTAYPVDPFLMRRIGGMLFVVEAEWELTELEASLLASLITGN